jgi:hypothetical protein
MSSQPYIVYSSTVVVWGYTHTLSVIAIMLHYIFALLYNALTLWRNIIARSEHIGAVIASYSYGSKHIHQSYCFY